MIKLRLNKHYNVTHFRMDLFVVVDLIQYIMQFVYSHLHLPILIYKEVILIIQIDYFTI